MVGRLVRRRLKERQRLTKHQPSRAQVNLAGDPRYAQQRAELEALLLAEMERLDDPYRLWCQPKK